MGRYANGLPASIILWCWFGASPSVTFSGPPRTESATDTIVQSSCLHAGAKIARSRIHFIEGGTMSDDTHQNLNPDRRGFLGTAGTAAMTVAAARLGLIGGVNASFANSKPAIASPQVRH